jgi:hypothetical protein
MLEWFKWMLKIASRSGEKVSIKLFGNWFGSAEPNSSALIVKVLCKSQIKIDHLQSGPQNNQRPFTSVTLDRTCPVATGPRGYHHAVSVTLAIRENPRHPRAKKQACAASKKEIRCSISTTKRGKKTIRGHFPA